MRLGIRRTTRRLVDIKADQKVAFYDIIKAMKNIWLLIVLTKFFLSTAVVASSMCLVFIENCSVGLVFLSNMQYNHFHLGDSTVNITFKFVARDQNPQVLIGGFIRLFQNDSYRNFEKRSFTSLI